MTAAQAVCRITKCMHVRLKHTKGTQGRREVILADCLTSAPTRETMPSYNQSDVAICHRGRAKLPLPPVRLIWCIMCQSRDQSARTVAVGMMDEAFSAYLEQSCPHCSLITYSLKEAAPLNWFLFVDPVEISETSPCLHVRQEL